MTATRAGVARSPSRAIAGSPGSARIHAKTRIDRPRRIGMRRMSRRTTNHTIVARRL
jgi:hypothetical protein